MLASERISKIYLLVKENGSVRVDELADHFKVSPMTIRRDLNKMEDSNLVVRCHGGAISKSKILSDVHFSDRVNLHMKSKIKIAQYCYEHLILDNKIIYLDAGSTILELAKLLRNKSELTVITNDIMIASTLYDTNLNVIILGGNVQHGLGCIHGYIAEKQISEYRLDAAFVSSLCMDEQLNIFATTEKKTFFRRELLKNSMSSYMLMDQSKLDKQSLYLINNLKEYNGFISDVDLKADQKSKIENSNFLWVDVNA